MPSSRAFSQPRDQTRVSCIADGLFTPELPGSPLSLLKINLSSLQPVEPSSSWLLSPSDTTTVIFDSIFAFWYDKIFQDHLVYFLPQTKN